MIVLPHQWVKFPEVRKNAVGASRGKAGSARGGRIVLRAWPIAQRSGRSEHQPDSTHAGRRSILAKLRTKSIAISPTARTRETLFALHLEKSLLRTDGEGGEATQTGTTAHLSEARGARRDD